MNTIKILAFAGSARQDSFNKTLVKIAAGGAKSTGAEVTYLDFSDLPMPPNMSQLSSSAASWPV